MFMNTSLEKDAFCFGCHSREDFAGRGGLGADGAKTWEIWLIGGFTWKLMVVDIVLIGAVAAGMESMA
jgi:hypothetical protein